MKKLIAKSIGFVIGATALASCSAQPSSSNDRSKLAVSADVAQGLQDGLQLSEVAIRGIAYAGTGCPAQTVAGNISPDRKALTLLFAEYTAEVGPGIDSSLSRRNCQITVDLDVPAGFQYTILDMQTRGYASLESGVYGDVKSTIYFQSGGGSESFSKRLSGPMNDDFVVVTSADLETEVWSSCGAQRALNINTELLVNNSADRSRLGFLTNDSLEGELVHKYAIRWRECEPLDQVQNLRVTSTSQYEVNAAWDRLEGATGYIVAQNRSTVPPTTCVGGQALGLVETFRIQNLRPNEAVGLRVCAVNLVGTFAGATLSTRATALPEAKALRLLSKTQTELTFVWSYSGAPITSYLISSALSPSTPAARCAGGTALTAQQFSVQNLQPGDTASLRVCSVDAQGNVSEGLSITDTTILPPPPTPKNLTQTAISPSSVSVSWESSGGTTIAYYAFINPIGATAKNSCIFGDRTSATTRTFSNLTEYAAYVVKVCAINRAGVISEAINLTIYTTANPRDTADILVGDVNGDGMTDLIGYYPPSSRWYAGISTGTTAGWVDGSDTTGQLQQVVSGDFTGDGRMDILGYWPQDYTWYLGKSNGSQFKFSAFARSGALKNVRVGDFNGDGKDDLVGWNLADSNWYIAVSNGVSITWAKAGGTGDMEDVVVGDFNGDGRTDLAGYYGPQHKWYIGYSSGMTFAFQAAASSGKMTEVYVGDVNGDGKADLIAYYAPQGKWYAGISNGVVLSFRAYAEAGLLTNVVIADVNGDGKTDVVGYWAADTTWYVGVVVNDKFQWQAFARSNTMQSARAGDFNGDGLTDIAAFDKAAGQWYLGRSTGSSFGWIPFAQSGVLSRN